MNIVCPSLTSLTRDAIFSWVQSWEDEFDKFEGTMNQRLPEKTKIAFAGSTISNMTLDGTALLHAWWKDNARWLKEGTWQIFVSEVLKHSLTDSKDNALNIPVPRLDTRRERERTISNGERSPSTGPSEPWSFTGWSMSELVNSERASNPHSGIHFNDVAYLHSGHISKIDLFEDLSGCFTGYSILAADGLRKWVPVERRPVERTTRGKSMKLGMDENITRVELACNIRLVHYIKVTTNRGRSLAVGSADTTPHIFEAPRGGCVIGFFGRQNTTNPNLFAQFGVIFGPISSRFP